MSGQFHISSDGKVRPCYAVKRPCPLGGGSFPTPELATEYKAKIQAEKLDGLEGRDAQIAERDSRVIDRYDELIKKGRELSEEELAERGRFIESRLDKAFTDGLSTDRQYSNGGIWDSERKKIHDEMLSEMLEKYKDVPCEGKVTMSAGLPGAGKTTVLYNEYGHELDNYATISSDDFKEMLAERGFIPEVDGLMPMEASTLVHAESSYLADRLLQLLAEQQKNIIYDFTAKELTSSVKRIETLTDRGYDIEDIQIEFINITPDEAIIRAKRRFFVGMNKDPKLGGRHLPEYIIDNSRAPSEESHWADSRNATVIRDLKNKYGDRFKTPNIYDNNGKSARKIPYDEFLLDFDKNLSIPQTR